jgi:AcrR family transcriptional regulator
MLKDIHRLAGRYKRELRRRRSDRRRSTLLRTGRQLLAQRDCDRVPVTEIASRAGCSVGAFYERFTNKNYFLGEVIRETFDTATATARRELEAENWRAASDEAVLKGIATHVVSMMSEECAGVMRAALKRGLADPSAFEPVLSYRCAVTDSAVALVGNRVSGDRKIAAQIRALMQVLHATVTDTILHNRGPLRPRSKATVDLLTDLMAAHLRS